MTPSDRHIIIAALHIARDVYHADAIQALGSSARDLQAYNRLAASRDSALELATRLEYEQGETA